VPRKPREPITLADHLRKISKRGGKARMNALTEEERQKLAAKAGKSGGVARAKALTAEQRSQIARNAAREMWRKRKLEGDD
jgi:hypothetical protein